MSVAEPRAAENRLSLPDHVLDTPEHGAGYYYPASAGGTPLWAISFGITLGLLSLLNMEVVNPALTPAIVPVALAVGGLAILVGGLWDMRAGNMFGGVAGCAFGGFYISFALMVQFFAAPLTEAGGPGGFGDALGAYLIIWAVVTAGLAVAAKHINQMAFAAFALLAVVFLVLGFANTGMSDGLTNLGGWLGLVDAALAMYLGLAIVANTTAGRDVLPIR